MKYQYPTISRPVTGKPAEAIITAVESGSHVASPKAVEVMRAIYDRQRRTREGEEQDGKREIRRR